MVKEKKQSVIRELCKQVVSAAESREKQLLAEIEAQRKENEELRIMIEDFKEAAKDPFRCAVTYPFVVEYISNRSETKAEPLISLFEALLPQSMQAKFREDINSLRDKNKAKRKSQAPTRIEVRDGSKITIVQGTNIEKVNDYNEK